MPKLFLITDAAEIVEILGGVEEVAKLTGAQPGSVRWNWLNCYGAFPASTYVVMITELRKRGYDAPPWLWKMRGFEKPTKRPATKRAA